MLVAQRLEIAQVVAKDLGWARRRRGAGGELLAPAPALGQQVFLGLYDWPAPAEGELIFVGDSQVFGLGIEDGETFSAGLAARSGRPVLNAGVPTYGPQEYMAVARELLAERYARAAIVVLNFVNDPFEIDRPNRERHAVWAG